MTQLTRTETGTILRALGWRTRTNNEQTQSVKHFQEAYNLGSALSVDGMVGPLTSAAFLRSYAAHKEGRPDISPHFYLSEFKCTCGGRYNACARIWTDHKLLVSLEKYRRHLGTSVKIISGCRCDGRNREIPGAATRSQHRLGRAADISHAVSTTTLKNWNCGFSGMGYRRSDGEVCHVDVRRSKSSSNPEIWPYGQW